MKRLTFVVILCVATSALGAEERSTEWAIAPRFWGASLFARYSFTPPAPDEVESSIIGGLSSAYETTGYYRRPDRSLFAAGDDGFTVEDSSYSRFDLQWQAGVQQGIAPRSDTSDDLAVVFFSYKGRYKLPTEDGSLYFASGLPGTGGSLLGSVHAGLAYSDVRDSDSTATRRGTRAEFVLQWGPPFLHNTVLGSADFTRMSLSARSYWPLFESAGTGNLNRFSLYWASFAAVDWATGPDVPMAVRSSFGTRSERPGTGGSVRGYESGRYDATFKAVANTELRANLPAIPIGPVTVVPGVLAYTDAGFYLDTDDFSPEADEHRGTLLSSGLGLYVDLRGIAEVIFYTNVLLGPPDIEGKTWVPFGLGFGFHF